MNIGRTILRAAGLSFMIFWTIIISEGNMPIDAFPFILLSIIPIFLCCTLAIIFTLAPVYWFYEKKMSAQKIYDIYFPYYTIFIFLLGLSAALITKFEIVPLAFIVSAFFTLLLCWRWIIKPPEKVNYENY